MKMVEPRTFIPTTCGPENGEKCLRSNCEKPDKFEICIYGKGKLVEVRGEVASPRNGAISYFERDPRFRNR